MKLPFGKSRLDLVKAGVAPEVEKRGRLVVSVAKIIEDPRNERKTFRNMEGLIASVRLNGIIEPITVTPEGDCYRILTGHRRHRAAVAAGLDRVEVLIREPEEENLRRRKSVVSNVQREDLGPVELAEALQSLMVEDPEIESQEDLARAIGKTKTWVSRILRILDLPGELQGKVASAQLSIPYDAVAAIARLQNHPEQGTLIDALLEGGTQLEIRERINHLKGRGASPGKAKPKRAFQTSHNAMVIVQSMNSTLELERIIAALSEAADKARAHMRGE